jgi:hypothetical protein
MGHINMDRVLTNGNKTCVLKNIGQYPGCFVPTDTLVNFEGCYVYYDTVSGSFVCSGKVNGENRSFLARYKEHLKSAKSKVLPLKFNKVYPSRPPQNHSQRSNSDTLKTCNNIAVLVSLEVKTSIEALHQTDGSGIFVWSKEMIEQFGAVNFANAKDLKAKQLHMVGLLGFGDSWMSH